MKPHARQMAKNICKICSLVPESGIPKLSAAAKTYHLTDGVSLITHSVCDKKDCEEVMHQAIITAEFTCPVCENIMKTLDFHKWNTIDGVELIHVTCSRECTGEMIRTSKKELKKDGIQYNTLCNHCKKEGFNFKKCNACKTANYCSRECQVADWKSGHKEQCKEYKKE